MNDANPRRDELESFKRLLSPLEKLITLAVPFELHIQVKFQRSCRTEKIHLHRMVDHQIDRHQWLDNFRIATEPFDCTPHCGKIDNQRHARKIL